jgi:predicted DNA-binding protein
VGTIVHLHNGLRERQVARTTNTDSERVAVNVDLTAGLLERIDRLAESAGVTRSALIRQAIQDTLEDAEDIAVSEARLADEDDPLVPWERVKAEAATMAGVVSGRP